MYITVDHTYIGMTVNCHIYVHIAMIQVWNPLRLAQFLIKTNDKNRFRNTLKMQQYCTTLSKLAYKGAAFYNGGIIN